MKLNIVRKIPEALLSTDVASLLDLLGGPTIIDLAGKHSDCVFVSTLLHGNESSGFEGIKQVLKSGLAHRGLCIFLGNVEAAAVGLRKLIHQPDYNRIWDGEIRSPEGTLAQEVLAYVSKKSLFAAIDIHNNTGRNPHYSCIAKTDDRSLQLAALSGRLSTYFTEPESTMTVAMAKRITAITLECGQSADSAGAVHAAEFIRSCLHIQELPTKRPLSSELTLFHTIARIRILEPWLFCFQGDSDEGAAEIIWAKESDRLNFSEVQVSTVLGWYRGNGYKKIAVDTVAEFGEHEPVLRFVDGRIELTRTLTPSMITLDRRIIREDCWGYLMEDMALSAC